MHHLRMDEIQVRCVEHFPISTSRPELIKAFRMVVDYLSITKVTCDGWLDGSFHPSEYSDQWVVVQGERLIAADTEAHNVFAIAKAKGIEVPFWYT